MKKDIFFKFVNRHWLILVLACVLFVGISLRTYNFHDWLRFNADQGRDAEVVSGVVEGKAPLPLLGPKAGGTEFKLGGAFYYFEIISAEIFGNQPDKLAYPDLFTGVLCIPLLFFLLRKYFDEKISLALTLIFAVSNYAVRYARFAWNPNSTPFWTMLALFAMHEVLSEKNKRKFLWATVCGVAVGVGVQLHTTLLLFLPVTAIIIFSYFAFKNIKVLKYFFVILAVSVIFNVPQLFGEYRSGGKNIKAFFNGIDAKQAAESTLANNTARGMSCWVQGNLDIISGYEISDKCSFTFGAHKNDTLAFIFGFIFVLGGTALGIQAVYKEKDFDKKIFLIILSAFSGITFLMFLKIAFELSVRFYLVLIFLPFFLLGFWLQFFKEKTRKRYFLILIVVTSFFVVGNLSFVRKNFDELKAYGEENGGDIEVTILSEAEFFSRFIVSNSAGIERPILDGDNKILFRAFKPIRYLVGKSQLELSQSDKKSLITGRYFYLGTLKDKKRLLQDPGVEVLKFEDYGNFAILLLQNK